jgi:hypothetical protein
MMADIRSIETKYNGYRFRSRLEARWAVFFDAAAIDYEYELEGFKLGDGLSYLPDFYLDSMGVYAEVKPNKELSEDEIRKLVTFSTDADKPLLLVIGTPGSEEMFLLNRRSLPSWREVQSWGQEVGSLSEAFLSHLRAYAPVEFGHTALQGGWTLLHAPGDIKDLIGSRIKRSRQKASEARFEFGETPKGPRDKE